MQRFWKILLTLVLPSLVGCRELPAYFQGNEPLAKVGGEVLYLHEVERMAPHEMTGDDSAAFYRLYAERWVSRQLKLQEAEQLFSASEGDIEQLVEEYRQSLLIRKLDQYYVDQQIDTLFTDEEIAAYYNAHLTEFQTDRTLVKGAILELPKGDRRTKQLRQLMESVKPNERKDLEDICLKNNFLFQEYNEWIDYEVFLKELPTLRGEEYGTLLNSSRVQEMEGGSKLYLFQLKAVRHSGEALPLEFVRETIRRILFKQRQSDLLNRRDNERLQAAEAEEQVKRYYLDTPRSEESKPTPEK